MRRLAFLTCLLMAPAALSALSLDELPAGAVYRISALNIEGVGFLQARTLRAEVLSVPAPWYKPWQRWTQPVTFEPKLFASDLERLKALLRETGYYEAEITYDLEPHDDQIEITLQVTPGPAVSVKSVDIKTTDFSLDSVDEVLLRSRLTLSVGETFTQKDYDESRGRLERYYLEKGYAYAEVTKSAVVDTGTHAAEVTYTVTREKPAIFGSTLVDGLKPTHEALARRELTYESGDPYDPRLIEKSQAKIFGLQLFRSLTVAPANLKDRSGVVDVSVHGAEGPKHTVRIGLGYGLEDQVRGQVQWQDHSFVGGGRQLGFRIKASLITQAVEGEFRQPYFLHPKQALIVPLTQTRDDEPGFSNAQTRLAPRIERLLPGEITVSLGYNVEYDLLSGVPDETQHRLEEFIGSGIVSSWIFTFERNTAGDLLDAHEGHVLSLLAEQGGGPWQGRFTFYRSVFEAKQYFGMWLNSVLALRGRVGVAESFGKSKDVPIFRRFFAGGINSTRGYGRYKLGPLTSEEDPIGGRSLVEGSIEWRVPLYGPIGGVAFFDVGEVREKAYDFQMNDLRYALGPGLRYNTPVGPLRVDVGIPLNQPSGLPSWQLHFSIGQAF